MALDYAIYDVFSDQVFSGNPLAIVFDADELDQTQMLAIAREFNLSETVFVNEPLQPAHSARLRIFTPQRELPFAGHPTVGTAIALAHRNHADRTDTDQMLILDELVGPVRCVVRQSDPAYCEFDLPRLPTRAEQEVDRERLAEVLGLEPHDIGFENHVISTWSAGNAFVFAPLHGLDAMARMRVDAAALGKLMPIIADQPSELFVYCRETVGHDCAFHARMMAPHMGIPEDPATGSAVAAFAGVIHLFDGLAEGPSAFWIEQGLEMGRPSRIRLEISAKGGEIASSRIGGNAVKVAEGKIYP